ncbi:PD-(D/E)XK nuclease family protein [Natrialbaceae archaeon GCM10025810]|uniref:PD-(D/E)XK nuclease family protein n=1 Tax=Halovalidus salilacus TaxID=3075124 RepID=UPI00360AB08A
MPTQSDTLTELREGCAPGKLPYISKSRVTTYKTCPRKFYYSYVLGMRTPDTYYTKRGRQVHETYEIYYENLLESYVDRSEVPEDLTELLPSDVSLWADWIEPYISNFILFEMDRRKAAPDDKAFLPVGVEAEGWDWEQAPPWMGYADVIVNASSLPQVENDEGVVIIDFKTGKTPDPKYRDDGIFLEGEYYAVLFEDEWDIAAVAGYFPMNDDFVISPLDAERRERIFQYVEEMTASTDREDFPVKEQPLCAWKSDEGCQCDFYKICSSSWGTIGGPGPNYFDENKKPL